MLSSWVAVGQRDLGTENANSHSKAGTAPSHACNLRFRETKKQDMLGQGQAPQTPNQKGSGNVCWINTPAWHESQCSPGGRVVTSRFSLCNQIQTYSNPRVFQNSEDWISKKVQVAVCLQGRQPAEPSRLAFPQPAARRFPFGTKLYACKTNNIAGLK